MGFIRNLIKKTDMGVTIDKNIKLSPGESLSSSHSSEKRNKLTLNEQFRNIGEQSHLHLQTGELGLYACDLYNLSKIHCEEQHYHDQLYLLQVSAYIHLSGVTSINDYNYWKNGDFSVTKPRPLLPPAVIRDTIKCIHELQLSLEQYRKDYIQNISASLTPAHVFGVEKSADIICTYLDGNAEKANKMVSSGTKKYIKEHSIKRQ